MGAISEEHKQAIVQAALARGDLRVLMTRTQIKAHRAFHASKATTYAVDCSRRWGKTVYSALLTYEQALKQKSIIRYVAPTKLHGRQFVQPTFAWLDDQLPASMRPSFDRQDNTWRWPNGSVCHLGSAETMGDVEAQVGTECHLAIVDEAGKVRSDLLKHLHRSVLRAQFLTTRGRCLIPSTPAISPAHYLTEIVATAQAEGAMSRYTIDDCDHVPVEERESMIRDLGGRKSTEVRRELYCEHVTERTRLIVPEWIDVAGDCTLVVDPQPWRDWFVCADFGFSDMTVVLFAWYDFESARIVIEDELAFHGQSALDVGFAVKAKEAELGLTKPLRVADAPPQLLADIANSTHGPGIAFGPAMKDDAEAALNHLRMRIARKQVIVNPRCKTLVSHLAYGTWNANRTSFDRVDGFGHWDALDALKYLLRAVDWQKNPTPSLLPGQSHATHFIPPEISREIAMQRRRAHEVFR